MKQTLTFVFTLFVFICGSFAQEEEDFNFLERPIESYITEVNFPGMGWITSGEVTFTYNSNNLVVMQLIKVLDYTTFTLKNTSRTTFTYNSSGVLQGDLEETWNSTTSSWVNEYRNTYTFSGGEIALIVTEMWQTGAWVNDDRSTFNYSGGLLSENIDEDWDAATSNWVLAYKTDYTYNSGVLASSTDYQRNKTTSSWDPSWRDTITYTGTIRTTLSENYIADSWVNSSRYTATLDTEKFIVEELDESWDEATSSWENETLSTRTKTEEGWLHILLIQSWEDENWEDAARITFTYRNNLSTGNIPLANNILIYPNPARDQLNISGIETNAVALKILNVNGQEVTNSKRTIGFNSIDISDLSSGIYFLKAEKPNSKIITKRFVKQ